MEAVEEAGLARRALEDAALTGHDLIQQTAFAPKTASASAWRTNSAPPTVYAQQTAFTPLKPLPQGQIIPWRRYSYNAVT